MQCCAAVLPAVCPKVQCLVRQDNMLQPGPAGSSSLDGSGNGNVWAHRAAQTKRNWLHPAAAGQGRGRPNISICIRFGIARMETHEDQLAGPRVQVLPAETGMTGLFGGRVVGGTAARGASRSRARNCPPAVAPEQQANQRPRRGSDGVPGLGSDNFTQTPKSGSDNFLRHRRLGIHPISERPRTILATETPGKAGESGGWARAVGISGSRQGAALENLTGR